jgi:hypothetical protein
MQKFEYAHLIPEDFSDTSRVWIYQSNRRLTLGEALQAEDLLNEFTTSWRSHGDPVKGYANLLFGQFIVILADESATGVSGCSTDSSVRLIKEMEKLFHVQLFDRQLLAFIVKDKIEVIPLSQLKYAVENGFIDAGTPYFNNLVQNKAELEKNWIIPVKDSWLKMKLPLTQKSE